MILKIENGCFSYSKSGKVKKNSRIEEGKDVVGNAGSVNEGSGVKAADHRMLLDNISLTAESGDVVAVLGPNGAGKTTLLRCMMGLLHWNSGRSTLNGQDILHMKLKELFSTIAYVPQAKNSVGVYTAEEMILIGRSGRYGVFSQPGKADIEIVQSVMERLGILELARKNCSEISGGELQMVLIARALASEPQILILDEPESNLDFKNQLIVMDTISKLASEGMTCIFNTHYPAHAMQRANKALLLSRDGHLFGNVNEVVTENNIESAFGVRAVIGEIETPGNIMRDVLPIEVTQTGLLQRETGSDARCLASISVILTGNFDAAEKINAVFHEYSRFIVGRLGMPYGDNSHIITAIFDAQQRYVEEIVTKLNILPGVSVKATYADSVPADVFVGDPNVII